MFQKEGGQRGQRAREWGEIFSVLRQQTNGSGDERIGGKANSEGSRIGSLVLENGLMVSEIGREK